MYIQNAPAKIKTIPSSPGSDLAVLSEKAVITELAKKINSTETLTATEIQLLISNLVDSSPAALNTLNELAAAINNDATFATTILALLASVNQSIEDINIIGKNIIPNSNDYSDCQFNLATIISNNELHPHGGIGATLFSLHSGSFDFYRSIASLVIGEKYTLSFFFKLGTAPNICIHITDGVGWNPFNAATEITTSGWNRAKITFTTTVSNIYIHIGGNNGILLQTAGTVTLYGMKLEKGDFATPYLEN